MFRRFVTEFVLQPERVPAGFSLIETMVALGIGSILMMAVAEVTILSQKGAQSNQLGSDFDHSMALVQQVLNNPTACANAFATQTFNPATFPSPIPVPTIAFGGNTVITVAGASPPMGLAFTKIQFNSIVETLSSASYLADLHIEAKKVGAGNTFLPGNNLFTADLLTCLQTTGTVITACGPSACTPSVITAIAAGSTSTCVVNNGGVQCWGSNEINVSGIFNPINSPLNQTENYGMLGNNLTPLTSSSPVQTLSTGVITTAGVTQITAGQSHYCALVSAAGGNGQGLMCWGSLDSGQAAQDFTSPTNGQTVPAIPAATNPGFKLLDNNVVDFSSGEESACAVAGTGQVICWGCNQTGERGKSSEPPPGGVYPLGYGGCGVGYNDYDPGYVDPPVGAVGTASGTAGVLGAGFGTGATEGPAQSVSGGDGFVCALTKPAGPKLHLYCWGECRESQMIGIAGNAGGPSGCCNTAGAGCADPTWWGVIPSPYDFTTLFNSAMTPGDVNKLQAITTGSYFICALVSTGNVYCWGSNSEGELGVGAPLGAEFNIPQRLLALSNMTKVKAKWRHACALKSDGTLWCWGYNYFGEIGQGNVGNAGGTLNYTTPVKVPGLSNVTDFALGRYHTCAVVNQQQVYCWGSPEYLWGGWGTDTPPPPMTAVPLFALGNSITVPTGTPTLVNGF
jgi:prepilin-type N-terminal cleavage/methylation domain-containing protein